METAVTIDSIKTRIKTLLEHDLDAQVRPEDIQDDVSLYEDGLGLDSISIVNLIVLLEQKFEITFTEDDLNYQLFSSINNLAAVIGRKLN